MTAPTSLPSPVLRNPQHKPQARLGMVSFPVPLDESPPGGLADLPTQTVPIGVWPESVAGETDRVRRQLMFCLSDGTLPETLKPSAGSAPAGDYDGPDLDVEIVSKKNTGIVLSETNEAVFRQNNHQFGLRMGLRHAGETHWWQWVQADELWSGPLCRAVRLGGFIEVEHHGDETLKGMKSSLESKQLHRHNWLRGEVVAWMFTNGVIRLTCRHINNHLFDHGRDLEDVIPIIGFRLPDPPEIKTELDGTRTRFNWDALKLNLDEAASLFGPEHPGRLEREDEMLIYQPYDGVEIHGDSHRREREDRFICQAEEKLFPKGVARTLSFMTSLSEAPPEIERLVVPDYWYAVAGELWPDGALPAHDEDGDQIVKRCEQSVEEREDERPRSFDDGVLVREVWEGEIAYSQMLYYYLSGDTTYLDISLNDAYHNADIGFDHATETIRMHNYPFGAIAPPLYRTVSMLFGYLETGDPYLRECAESAAIRYYWIDRHNWPRRSYGRDAASLRSLIFLWDYTGKENYMDFAREALQRCIQCQRDNGSYGDQGGAVGVCGGVANEITKPWMALLANDPMVDYYSRRPDEDILDSMKKTGDFLLDTQLEDDGVYYWAYQYAYGDNPGDPWDMMQNPDDFTPFPTRRTVSGYKARFLPFLSLTTGNTEYLAAWLRTFHTFWVEEDNAPKNVGYTSNKVVQNVPYFLAHLWNARPTGDGVRVEPLGMELEDNREATISTPYGPLKFAYQKAGDSLTIRTEADADFAVQIHLPDTDEPIRMKSQDERSFELF